MKTRRRSLLAATLGLGLSPLLRAFQRASAAEPAGAPSAFVGVYMPHGVARELWRPSASLAFLAPESSLAPFDDPGQFGRSFREQVLVIEGLDLAAGIAGGSAGHEGARALFTGSAFDGKSASLDQFLAVEQGLGETTPVSSLVLGVGDAATRTSSCISYAPGGTPLPKLTDPTETYFEVIEKWQKPSDPAAQATAAAARRRGQSVLDALRADLSSLAARAGAAERAKLDAHATALRALEKRLAGFELACSQPLPRAPEPNGDPASPTSFDAITELQLELLAFAIGCGVTRFATLHLADLSYTGLDPSLPADIHESVAHRYAAAGADGLDPGKPETWSALARHNRYSYSKVARLLQRLDEAGALDSTLVLASSDMGDPARHSSRNVPTLLAGGASASPGIRWGRYLDVRRDGAGVPNNQLLVSLARAFGAELDSFGDAPDEIASGALDLS